MPNIFENRKKNKKPTVVGSIRQSQLITTYGIGSIVDFVDDTVIIAGVDDWDISDESSYIFNENLSALTGAKFFVSPKTEIKRNVWEKSLDIPSFVFPEKLYCPICHAIIDYHEVKNSKHPYRCNRVNNGRLCNAELVPSRFVVICENGHMEDFPYSWWVHKGNECPSGKKNPRIKMYNVGNRSDIDSLYLECEECHTKRQMSGAFQENAFGGDNGYKCSNQNPHIKSRHIGLEHPCNATMKTRLRSSTSVYFPVVQSALSIPPWSRYAVQLIQKEYNRLKFISKNQLEEYIKENILSKITKPITLDDLLNAYNTVCSGKEISANKNEEDIYYDEYRILTRGTTEADEEYSAMEVEIADEFKPFFNKIVSIDKLTVIESLCGFTREKPWAGNDLSDERIVKLSEKPIEWLPAVKFNGEGVFIEFNMNEVQKWKARIGNRYEKMRTALEKSYFQNNRFSEEYVMLHTFSHLLIRELSESCGYNAASIKEKIYSTFIDSDRKMCGVLIYLATSDCEGSLGGLISIVKDTKSFEEILKNMLIKSSWCSADPLCCNSTQQGYNSLNYAACHDCTLLPETSCEFRNVLLDRVSVVGLIDNHDMGYLGSVLHNDSNQNTIITENYNHTSKKEQKWEKLKCYLDDEFQDFIEDAEYFDIPAPSEDDIGYEILGTKGNIVSTIEIAWPEKKIGLMTAEQLQYRHEAEDRGWKIFDINSLEKLSNIFKDDE